MNKIPIKLDEVEFLQNYRVFGSEARLITAKLLLGSMISSDLRRSKIYYSRILEEFSAASEDLEMWYTFLKKRYEVNFEVWEFMLRYFVTVETSRDFFNDLIGINIVDDFLQRMNYPRIDKLAQLWEAPVDTVNRLLGSLVEKLKIAATNRVVGLPRIQNKVKHGYAVFDMGQTLLIRDIQKSGRLQYIAEPTFEEAKRFVDSIEAYSISIKNIITLVTYELVDLLKSGNVRISDTDRELYLRRLTAGFGPE